MKKIILILGLMVLAILITAVSYFFIYTPSGQFDASTSYRGLLVPYSNQTHATYDFGTGNFPIFPPKFNIIIFLIDILLWFIVLKIVWFIIEIVIKKLNKNY